MKTNYKLQTIKTGIAIFAMALTFNFASAQTEIDGTTNLRTTTTTTYAAGPITIVTSGAAINQEGVTFNLQATVTPNSTANGASAFIESNGNNRWGVDDILIDGPNGESVIVTDIIITDFNDNGTGYMESAISNLHFEGITFRAAQNVADNPRITVNGTSAPGTLDVGQLVQNQYVEFGVEFMNVPGDTFTVGGTEDVTSVTLTNATTAGADSFQVISFVAGYTFTTDPALSVKDVVKKDAISIYPTVVENTFSVNKAFETLQLFDITGKTVKTFSASDALEVSGLVSGLYIVKIQSEVDGISTGRLIVK